MINEERGKLGLTPLTYDATLSKACGIRAREMYVNNYFDHTRPDGQSWRAVIDEDVPVAYKTAGENLAMVEHNMTAYDPARDASHWFDGWKNSPPHYENIIRAGYTHVGVAIYSQKEKNGLSRAYAVSIFTSYYSK